MNFKIIAVIFGLLLLIAGILLVVFKPNGFIAYPVSLIGLGGYLFAVGLSSTLMAKLYYKDTSEASASRNKMIRMIEIFAYSFIGIVMIVTIILCFTVLK
jgi:hypothetical protein